MRSSALEGVGDDTVRLEYILDLVLAVPRLSVWIRKGKDARNKRGLAINQKPKGGRKCQSMSIDVENVDKSLRRFSVSGKGRIL